MKKTLLLSLLLIGLLTAFRAAAPLFEGVIVYKITATGANGQDLTERLAAMMGREQHYYVKGAAYKTLNEKNELVQLYDPATGKYLYFMGGKLMKTMTVTEQGGPATVTRLPDTETVLGHTCQAIRIDADGSTTTYFYSPEVRVDPALYTNHNLANWNTMLKATNGALPLKYVVNMPQAGYTLTTVATQITPQKLSAADFTAPAK